jgi:hypothetical protein
MRHLKRFNEGFEGDKVVSDLQIFISWKDNYDTRVAVKKWSKGEGPGIENKGKVDRLFAVSENDTVIKVSVSLNQQAVWDGKEISINQFEDDVNMTLEYLEDLTDGEVDFYFIVDFRVGNTHTYRLDDMRDKLALDFGGNLIEMFFIERG